MNVKKVFGILEESHTLTMLEELGDYTPFQKIVMTLLSARSKDSTVVPIVKEFFSLYPTVQDVVGLPVSDLEKWFFRIGFYRVKAKHVKKLCSILINDFDSKVPETREEMMTLPGVGRKTANCMLNYAFGKAAVAVDIHVHRIANRLGWINTKTPSESEFALMEVVPKSEWINVNRLLVGHGQTICSPVKPKCSSCSVREYCDYGKNHDF